MGWSLFRKTGLTHHLAAQTVKGYTLVTPVNGDSTYVIDMAGRIVQRWHFPDLRVFYGRLLPTGNLLILGTEGSIRPPEIPPGTTPPFEVNIRRLGGSATHLREVDWDGSVVWEYANQAIHHDFVRLANGNTLFPEWVEMPAELARTVRGGFRERNLPPMLGDDFVEIDPQGNEMRRVSLWKLLDPRRDAICPLERRLEWTHTKSLDVTAAGGILFSCRSNSRGGGGEGAGEGLEGTHTNSLDVRAAGEILFSCRSNSRVGLIDGAGKLVWKYGAPNVYHQHHASALGNGNIQVFDNGMHRPGMPRSRVVEVNPKDGSTVWQYAGNPEASFFSAHISGAERLAGDNVLVCEGAPGRVFEITRAGEVVWEWISPFSYRAPSGQIMPFVFRVHRYSPDHAALKGRELDPARFADLNRLYGLDQAPVGAAALL